MTKPKNARQSRRKGPVRPEDAIRAVQGAVVALLAAWRLTRPLVARMKKRKPARKGSK